MLPSSTASPLKPVADGVRLNVRLSPRARANQIDGATAGSLRVSVTAPPVENLANDALLRLLARKWRLPRRDLSIVIGAKNRNKIVHIAGDPPVLMAWLNTAIAMLSEL